MKFTNKNNLLFYISYVLNVLFCNEILSCFAKPKFIIYDEWFDENSNDTKLDVKNKKIESNMKIKPIVLEKGF